MDGDGGHEPEHLVGSGCSDGDERGGEPDRDDDLYPDSHEWRGKRHGDGDGDGGASADHHDVLGGADDDQSGPELDTELDGDGGLESEYLAGSRHGDGDERGGEPDRDDDLYPDSLE
ncbi:hypothetical protein DAT35_55590 [Vitiosangium sp. GDMCC 1.1324]|nr:hypothetical protein DAT35_55590 [Vitiosangium sp. GDMCC 1.1324]